MNEDFSDIIHLPHHVSTRYPQMPIMQRAAQFSPFAALTGYDASVKEEARLTESQTTLADDAAAELNRRMAILREHLTEHPTVAITYFQPDARKAGGHYQQASGPIAKIDDIHQIIHLTDGTQIPIHTILDLTAPLFDLPT